MKGLALAVIAIALAGPASAGGLADYSWTQADAKVPVGKVSFNLWVNQHRPAILIEPSMKTVLSGGGHYPDPVWRTVAEAFVQPVGCSVSAIKPLTRMGAAWEATYACPDGVDLIALAKAQRPALKAGQPLHPAATPSP